jgi:hypothetical protein
MAGKLLVSSCSPTGGSMHLRALHVHHNGKVQELACHSRGYSQSMRVLMGYQFAKEGASCH